MLETMFEMGPSNMIVSCCKKKNYCFHYYSNYMWYRVNKTRL